MTKILLLLILFGAENIFLFSYTETIFDSCILFVVYNEIKLVTSDLKKMLLLAKDISLEKMRDVCEVLGYNFFNFDIKISYVDREKFSQFVEFIKSIIPEKTPIFRIYLSKKESISSDMLIEELSRLPILPVDLKVLLGIYVKLSDTNHELIEQTLEDLLRIKNFRVSINLYYIRKKFYEKYKFSIIDNKYIGLELKDRT